MSCNCKKAAPSPACGCPGDILTDSDLVIAIQAFMTSRLDKHNTQYLGIKTDTGKPHATCETHLLGTMHHYKHITLVLWSLH